MNGLEVQERLASSGNGLPVIFITAHDQAGVRDRALAAGAVAFLRKPFDDESFITTLAPSAQIGAGSEQVTLGAMRNGSSESVVAVRPGKYGTVEQSRPEW